MKVLVFGANGRTGKALLPLLNKHEVVAYEGDVLDAKNVDVFVKGVDVVVSVIGHRRGSDKSVQTKGIRNIVNAMEKHSVMRLISLTGTGVRVPGDKITFIDKILNLSIKLIDPSRVQDGIEHVEFLKSTRLDWTVIRVLKLTNGALTDKWKLSLNGPAKTLVSRTDVAAAILLLIDTGEFSQKAPIISSD